MMKLFLCIIGVASALADNFQLFKNSNDQFTAKMLQVSIACSLSSLISRPDVVAEGSHKLFQAINYNTTYKETEESYDGAVAEHGLVDSLTLKQENFAVLRVIPQYMKEVVKASEGKSVILSAFSVLPPLAQLALASTGPSHDELLTAIALPNDEKTKEVFSELNQQLKTLKGVTLTTASRIYIAQDAKLNKEFAALSRDIFNSDVINLDFGRNEQSARKINAWVQQQTNNKIKNLLDRKDLNKSTKSVLVNAIYFKGEWKKTFNRDVTKFKDFHVSKSETVKVATMQLRHNFKYGESAELDAKLLELPYTGDEASFLIVLPNEIDGLTKLEKKLKDPSALNKATEEMQYRNNVILSMPKFKIETKTDLGDILKKINVTKLFSPYEAKLDNLLENESNMYIGKAIQKAFMEVNEEGTEAAAANAFISLGSSRKPIVNTIFKVNRPFYFEIRYNNTALFNGAVVNL